MGFGEVQMKEDNVVTWNMALFDFITPAEGLIFSIIVGSIITLFYNLSLGLILGLLGIIYYITGFVLCHRMVKYK